MRKEVNRSDRVGIFDRQLKVYKCSMRGTGSEEWKHGEQQKETSTTPPLHNPTRKDPDRVGTGGAPAERNERQNQSLPHPSKSSPPFQKPNPKR